MASNSSGALSPSQTYKLGDYTFRLVVTYLPDENLTSVQCHASNGSSNKQTGKDYEGRVNVLDWRVEADEKTASIYISKEEVRLATNSTVGDLFAHLTRLPSYDRYYTRIGEGDSYTSTWTDTNGYTNPLAISTKPKGVWYHCSDVANPGYNTDCKGGYTKILYGKTFYIQHEWGIQQGNRPDPSIDAILASVVSKNIYTYMIARFEINVQDADAGNWDYPADTGEPSKTLHITVTGALSGRHNDPLNDTSYHYTPSDREQADVYGSGGVGGNGGAGGAGASTVIIYNCATDKAGYTEEIAIARRHGYGSGAGKGGKGGNGCILVYY